MPKKNLKAPDDLYIVMVAGGVGTRLWPLSRRTTPKQFLQIFEDSNDHYHSLVQITYKRLHPFVKAENIFVVAPQNYKGYVQNQLPDLPEVNFIAEPSKQGTTAASIYSNIWIKRLKKNPEAVVHYLVADDYIEDIKRFRKMILASYQKAKEKKVVVFGVKPADPATGFGYIEIKPKSEETIEGVRLYKVNSFKEKPNEEKAKEYLETGRYYWHGSGYMARLDTLIEEIDKNHPEIVKKAEKLEETMQLPYPAESVEMEKSYKSLDDIPIEHVLHEKSQNVYMAEMEETWNDLGSWTEIYEVFRKKGKTNVIWGDEDKTIQIDSKESMIYSTNRLVALVGIDDLVVIDTPDALLVCHKHEAQKVKQLVKKLKKEKRKEYL